ncbi:hypothetical protein ACHAWF_018143 [Thalassiosira exigua]
MEGSTKREVKEATLAREAFLRTGGTTEKTLKSVVSKMNFGCPVHTDAFSDALIIRGADRPGVRGKMVQRISLRVDKAVLDIPSLLPEKADELPSDTPRETASLAAFSAYDLPSVAALVRYFHAAAGYPVKTTWLQAIKAGNYASWPGLTYNNAARYCPTADATIKGHMVQGRQGVRSTKPQRAPAPAPLPTPATAPAPATDERSNELHIRVEHISRLYTDDTGRFPVRSRSGNQYIMVAYHCDSGAILACPFKSRKDTHRLEAYNSIMRRLKSKGLHVDLQILDNEASVPVGLSHPPGRNDPQLPEASTSQPRHLSLGILPRALQLRRNAPRSTGRPPHRTQQTWLTKIVGLSGRRRMERRRLHGPLSLPAICGQIDARGAGHRYLRLPPSQPGAAAADGTR